MLEIFILFKVGQAINRRAKSKGWPGWPFVILLVIMYICCAISGVVAVLILSDKGGNDDNPFEFIIGYALGAIAGAVASYLIVLLLPDRSEPIDDYDRDHTRRLSERDKDDEDDEDRPRRFRGRDDDADDRDSRRGRRADDDDWRRR